MVQQSAFGGHANSFIYGIMCLEIRLLMVLFATDMNMITRNEDKMIWKLTLAYGATQCFGIKGYEYEDSFIYSITFFEVGLLLELFVVNSIIIKRNDDKTR